MRRPVVKSLSFLRFFAGFLAFWLAGQTSAICENVTPVNGVTFSIISPRDSSLWVGTASKGLLRIGATGRPFAYSTLTGHLECDSIVSLAFDENGLLWIRDGRDVVLTYSTLEGFVPCTEVPASVRDELFKTTAPEETDAPIINETKKPAVWPWILVVSCLVAVICFLLVYYSRKQNARPVSSPKPEIQPLDAAEIAPKEELKTAPEKSEEAPKIAPKEAPVKAPGQPRKEAPVNPEIFPEIAFEDRDFESKVRDIIEKNYTDKDFSVDQLAAELGISRVHLSRKLKALAAQSPSDMIKARRMSAAADMLRSGERNMAVVAASCGFASAAYFSSAFKAFYGVSPSVFE